MIRGMVIDLNDKQLTTLMQLQTFLDGTLALDFALAPDDRYEFIARTVRRFGYSRLKRTDKSVVLLSRAGQRLFAPATHPLGQTRRGTSPAHQALPRLTHQFCTHLYQR